MPRPPRALAMLGAVLLAVCAAALAPGPAPRAEATTYGPVARAGLAAVGTYGGQCFPWVRQIVFAATSRMIGYDYRAGYFQAGAVEVSVQDARQGDVIQIANDANTSPSADYPGLHTAIILANEGNGFFQIVDSNSEFAGIVRVRDRYSPAADAARYPGLSFHIYRIPGASAVPLVSGATSAGGATGSGASPAPAGAVTVTAGDVATVAAGGDCLRLRGDPGLSGPLLTCLPTGAPVRVSTVGPTADGYRWALISSGARSGWVAAEYLARTATATPTPSSTPPPVVPPSPTPTASPTPAPTPPPAAATPAPPPAPPTPTPAAPAPAPSPTPTATPAPAPAAGSPPQPATYVVVAGDTLSGIAQRLHPASVPFTAYLGELYAFNGLDQSAVLQVGQSLVLPAAPGAATAGTTAAPASSSATTPSPAPAQPATYTVAAGDTLSALAQRFHPASVPFAAYLDALYSANGLGPQSILSIGQVLVLPPA